MGGGGPDGWVGGGEQRALLIRIEGAGLGHAGEGGAG